MEVKNGVAKATMTDVKNLIGDVFELVDKHGAVEITSYGTTKYIIQKHSSVSKNKQNPNAQTDAKQKTTIKTETNLTEVNLDSKQRVNTTENLNSYVNHNNKEERDLRKLEMEKLNKLSKLIHIPNLTIPWDRDSDLEQNWVQTARNLL